MQTVEAEKIVSRVLTEDVLSLAEAQAELERTIGRRPDKATITRWIHKGAGGVRLEAVRVGTSLLVSKQSLSRFITARTAQTVGAQ